MQREQPISLVRSLSASIEQIEWQARTVGVGDTEAHGEQGLHACLALCV